MQRSVKSSKCCEQCACVPAKHPCGGSAGKCCKKCHPAKRCCTPEKVCVQTCASNPLSVEATVTLEQPEEPLPVFGQIEICNCCDSALRVENDQLRTSRDIGDIPAGTSMADLLAMLIVAKQN